jgi:hypothetical protein
VVSHAGWAKFTNSPPLHGPGLNSGIDNQRNALWVRSMCGYPSAELWTYYYHGDS